MLDFEEIESIEYLDEEQECYDITNFEEDFLFDEPNFVAEGFVVHNSGMHEHFIKRKKGLEEYTIFPVLEAVLRKTYGVMVYQEQVMQILNIVGLIPLKDCEAVRKAISKKKVEKFIKYYEMFIENGQRVLGISKEEVQVFWDQIVAFAEYGFNKSHSVSYTYLSSRLLWLKAHYPLEFYAAILMCETKEDKIKEYKRDAFKHNIEVERLDLNKSKETFSIVDEKIYFGFSHVKGIGEEVARKIVQNQPYKSFEDFLIRFGTDASVIKPLLGLDAFSCFNQDKIKLYKFYECYKDWKKKKDNRNKRVDESIQKQQGFLNDLLKDNLELAKFDEECYEAWKQFDKNEEIYEGEEEVIDLEYLTKKYKVKRLELRDMLEQDAVPLEDIKYIKRPKFRKFNLYNELCKVRKKRERTLDDLSYKIGREDIEIPKMDKMIDEDWYIESELVEVLTNKDKAELQYYGFLWQHPLEKSPDFQGGLTIERLLQEAETEGLANGPIEVVILEVEAPTNMTSVRLKREVSASWPLRQSAISITWPGVSAALCRTWA
jgi:DNA polymerase III alpha subunit